MIDELHASAESETSMSKVRLDLSEPDMVGCDTEEIRIPGSIQPHGFLLLLDECSDRILVMSENAETYLGIKASSLLGTSVSTIFPPQLISALRTQSSSTDLLSLMGYLGAFELSGELFGVILHRLSTGMMVELEQLDQVVKPEEMNAEIAHFVGQLGIISSEQELYQVMSEQIARLTGFDRVLLYSFDDIGHGTVLTEENNGVLPSYRDLRFPASDIPSQARELYVVNTMRSIPDATYTPSPLLGLSGVAAATLDLSQCVLRSVSPIHLEYMRNMGTAASMSFSILSDGQLWGLISAHNAAPRKVPFLIRSVCDLLTKMGATQLKAFRTAAELKTKVRFQAVHRRILTQMAAKKNYLAAMELEIDELLNVTNAKGVALLIGGRLGRSGKTPDDADLFRLVDWLDDHPDLEVFESHHLSSHMDWTREISDVASGMLAVRISDVKRGYILWFRPEIVSTVTWAGEPVKLQDVNLRLHPRLSFAHWQETVLGKSLPWTEMEAESANEFRMAILKIFLKRAEEAEHLSEARFEQLTHAIPTLVWTADDHGNLTYVNQHWRRRGLPESGRWYDVGVSEAQDVVLCRERWGKAVANGLLFEEEVRLRDEASEDGQWHLVRAVPFEGADGTRAGWLGTCTDLTDRRVREQALRMSEKLAITGRMTSVIAHEINNPLEAITNIMYLLKGMMISDEGAQEYFAMAEAELARISGITKQTLRWSRDDVHRPEWTTAGYLFEDAIRLFAGKSRNRNLTVSITGGAEVPVYGVVGQLRQVLTNLLSNALDAVAAGGSIRLKADVSTDFSELFVDDAGVGMSQETLQKIFEPYFSTKGDLGNGLGLYISKEIVERHGGTLQMISELNRGTTVIVRLPAPTT